MIGFITYNQVTAKYLPFFGPSLRTALASVSGDYQILAVDNSDATDNANAVYLNNNFPEIDLIPAGSNLGFARAYNLMIERASKLRAEYFLMLNPDMVLTPNSIVRLIEALASDESLGAVAPRILKWDFENNIQTKIIDSDGLSITSSYNFSDRHQGEEVNILEPEMIFGFTGAAALIRVKALVDVAYNNQGHTEYLDVLMFVYKEDVDLSYRLQLAGWPIKLIPEALVYHDRTASPAGESWIKVALNRRHKSRQVKRWSFLNQWILVIKYSKLDYPFRVKFRIWFYQLASLVFVLFFETYLISELGHLGKIWPEIKARRQSLKIVVNPIIFEKTMD